jgi:hypothetical protein
MPEKCSRFIYSSLSLFKSQHNNSIQEMAWIQKVKEHQQKGSTRYSSQCTMIAELKNLTTHLPRTHKLQDLPSLWAHGIDTTVKTFETIIPTYANTTTYIRRAYEVLTQPNWTESIQVDSVVLRQPAWPVAWLRPWPPCLWFLKGHVLNLKELLSTRYHDVVVLLV